MAQTRSRTRASTCSTATWLGSTPLAPRRRWLPCRAYARRVSSWAAPRSGACADYSISRRIPHARELPERTEASEPERPSEVSDLGDQSLECLELRIDGRGIHLDGGRDAQRLGGRRNPVGHVLAPRSAFEFLGQLAESNAEHARNRLLRWCSFTHQHRELLVLLAMLLGRQQSELRPDVRAPCQLIAVSYT